MSITDLSAALDPNDPHAPCRRHIEDLQQQLLNQAIPGIEVWYDDDKGVRRSMAVRHIYATRDAFVVVVEKP